jgi:hypothetical protein
LLDGIYDNQLGYGAVGTDIGDGIDTVWTTVLISEVGN